MRLRAGKGVSHHWGSHYPKEACVLRPHTPGPIGYTTLPPSLPPSYSLSFPSFPTQGSLPASTDSLFWLQTCFASGGWTWMVLPTAFSPSPHCFSTYGDNLELPVSKIRKSPCSAKWHCQGPGKPCNYSKAPLKQWCPRKSYCVEPYQLPSCRGREEHTITMWLPGQPGLPDAQGTPSLDSEK